VRQEVGDSTVKRSRSEWFDLLCCQ